MVFSFHRTVLSFIVCFLSNIRIPMDLLYSELYGLLHVYISVPFVELCPSGTCILLRLTPASNRCLVKLCRRAWGNLLCYPCFTRCTDNYFCYTFCTVLLAWCPFKKVLFWLTGPIILSQAL